ncbi:nonstructural protein [European shore crab virus 1]|uniref:Nonstructural protein n=1 Tax=European shore crab virus 1 TaxID=2847074 RepID=A0A5J6CW91_9VIRU|nr:nonstructural protein [European shore crab virus 1]QEQ51087.1 nonstructural protein [European shore crab virus 1]
MATCSSNPFQTVIASPNDKRTVVETSVIHELAQKRCIQIEKHETCIKITVPCCNLSQIFTGGNKISFARAYQEAYSWLLTDHLGLYDTSLVWQCHQCVNCPYCYDLKSVKSNHKMIHIDADNPSSITKLQSWATHTYYFVQDNKFTFKANFCCGITTYSSVKQQNTMLIDTWKQLMDSDHHVIIDEKHYLLIDTSSIDDGFCPACARRYTE